MSLPNPSPTPRRSRGLTVIFKGSNRCNARCTFCSVGEHGGALVSWEDFEIVARELEAYVVTQNVGRLQFTFHGGEPTLLGAEFIDRACERIATLPARVGFSMQSNLLWRDDALIEVIKKHAIALGTSIDPISGDRRDVHGRPAHATWLANYLWLCTHVKPPGAIFVITQNALGRAEDLVRVATEIGMATGQPFGLQLNPVYPQGRAAQNGRVLITPRELGQFLIEAWHLGRRHAEHVRITPLQEWEDYFFPKPGRVPELSCAFKGTCSQSHVGIDFDLNVAGCGRRLDSGAYFGSLRTASLIELVDQSPENARILLRSETLLGGECRDCEYFEVCSGGCPDDAELARGDVGQRFRWCEGVKLLFAEMASAARRQRVPGARTGNQPTEPTPIEVRVLARTARGDTHGAPGPNGGVWVLPHPSGQPLRFESGLAAAFAEGAWPGTLWVHNRHVESASLWEDLLHKQRVSVTLFEAEGLEAAVEVLNELGAVIALDVLAIASEPGGPEALERLVERFVFGTGWKSQLFPFAQLLLDVVHRRSTQPRTRWGLPPGGYRLELGAGTEAASEVGARLLDELRSAATVTLATWMEARRACGACELEPQCGRRFARGDGEPCDPAVQRLVRRLAEIGVTLRRELAAVEREEARQRPPSPAPPADPGG